MPQQAQLLQSVIQYYTMMQQQQDALLLSPLDSHVLGDVATMLWQANITTCDSTYITVQQLIDLVLQLAGNPAIAMPHQPTGNDDSDEKFLSRHGSSHLNRRGSSSQHTATAVTADMYPSLYDSPHSRIRGYSEEQAKHTQHQQHQHKQRQSAGVLHSYATAQPPAAAPDATAAGGRSYSRRTPGSSSQVPSRGPDIWVNDGADVAPAAVAADNYHYSIGHPNHDQVGQYHSSPANANAAQDCEYGSSPSRDRCQSPPRLTSGCYSARSPAATAAAAIPDPKWEVYRSLMPTEATTNQHVMMTRMTNATTGPAAAAAQPAVALPHTTAANHHNMDVNAINCNRSYMEDYYSAANAGHSPAAHDKLLVHIQSSTKHAAGPKADMHAATTLAPAASPPPAASALLSYYSAVEGSRDAVLDAWAADEARRAVREQEALLVVEVSKREVSEARLAVRKVRGHAGGAVVPYCNLLFL